MTPDVNVLVAAYRDDLPQHAQARAWLSGVLENCASGGTLEILPMVAAGFLRLVTNRKVFRNPASPHDAVAFLREILSVPGASMPTLGNEWRPLEKLCVALDLRGNDIPDAWIAAAVTTGGFHLVTYDSDFRRLLRPTEYTLLEPGSGVRESRARYAARRARRRPIRKSSRRPAPAQPRAE